MANLGEKLNPMPRMYFLRYSGIWGSVGLNFSGYWGPAYNETEQDKSTGFFTAWAEGMLPSVISKQRHYDISTGDYSATIYEGYPPAP